MLDRGWWREHELTARPEIIVHVAKGAKVVLETFGGVE